MRAKPNSVFLEHFDHQWAILGNRPIHNFATQTLPVEYRIQLFRIGLFDGANDFTELAIFLFSLDKRR